MASDTKNKKTHPEFFRSLCRQIISQQLSGKAADTIQGRFENLFSGKLVSPEKLIQFEDSTLRDVGMSWAKVSYVKNIATEILGNNIRWGDFYNLNDEDVIAELIKIKGAENGQPRCFWCLHLVGRMFFLTATSV